MKYSSVSTHESKTCPGVTFKLRKRSLGRRNALELELAEYRQKHWELTKRSFDLPQVEWELDAIGQVLRDENGVPKVKADPRTPVQRLEAMRLDQQADFLEKRYAVPAYLKVFVAKIEGLELDSSEQVSVDALLSDGPGELAEEIYSTILLDSGLTPDEQKN